MSSVFETKCILLSCVYHYVPKHCCVNWRVIGYCKDKLHIVTVHIMKAYGRVELQLY